MKKFDNQGRNLEGVKKHFDREAEQHRIGSGLSHEAFLKTVARYPLADWTTYEGVLVLRAGKSKYVAVPATNKEGITSKKKAANFVIIDIEAKEEVAFLKKNEVREWLWKASQV